MVVEALLARARARAQPGEVRGAGGPGHPGRRARPLRGAPDVHEPVRPLGGGGGALLQGAAGGRAGHPRRAGPALRPAAAQGGRRRGRPQRAEEHRPEPGRRTATSACASASASRRAPTPRSGWPATCSPTSTTGSAAQLEELHRPGGGHGGDLGARGAGERHEPLQPQAGPPRLRGAGSGRSGRPPPRLAGPTQARGVLSRLPVLCTGRARG